MNSRRYRKRKQAKIHQKRILILFTLFLLGVLLYVGNHKKNETPDISVVDVLSIEEKNMLEEIETSGNYPEDLVEKAKNFPETVRFVHHYCHEETNVPRPRENGRVPHYLQWDTRWGYKPYCETFFASAGCGPTAMAMAIRGVNKEATVMPYDIAMRAEALGYAIADVGTDAALFSAIADEYDVSCVKIVHEKGLWKRILAEGGTIILNVGPGDFTNYGHFIVLTDYVNDKFQVLDPNSITRSKLWSFKTLERQTKYAWLITKNS